MAPNLCSYTPTLLSDRVPHKQYMSTLNSVHSLKIYEYRFSKVSLSLTAQNIEISFTENENTYIADFLFCI